ncbi:MAG TPA: ATP-grasp domain-containing protein [Methanobacteriaceae archaeon]|nr:ATP-grasp domain-containing protein [Methanobacteriaceae archaeon]
MNKEKLNILVTGVGSEVGQGVIKAIRLSKYNCRIIGCDMNPDSAGFFMCDDYSLISPVISENYEESLFSLCREKKIDMIIPTVDVESPVISNLKSALEEEGIVAIVQPPEILEIFLNKYNTYRFFKGNGVGVPETLKINEGTVKEIGSKLGFPMIIKPEHGQGSKSVYKINNFNELNFLYEIIKDEDDYVAQSYIPSSQSEYTCAVFNCPSMTEPNIIVLRRQLENGTSWISEVVFDDVLIDLCKKVSQLIDLEGAINIQLRKFQNKPFIFEINPRYSSTSGIRANCGFNDVEMAIDHFIHKKTPSKPEIRKKKILRYIEELYIDL